MLDWLWDGCNFFYFFFFYRLTLLRNSRSLPWAGKLIPSMLTYKSQLRKGKWHGLRSTIPAFWLKIFCEEGVPGISSTSVSSENGVKAVDTDRKLKGSCSSIHRRWKSQGKQLQRVKKEGEREGGWERAREEETTSLDIWQWGQNASPQIKMCSLQ